MNASIFAAHLIRLRACPEAREWAKGKSLTQAWRTCQRGDWLLWLAARAGVRRENVVLAACACARLSLPHVPSGEERPLRAIETAEQWTRGKATLAEVRAAAADAYAAAVAATAYAATAYAAYAAAAAAAAAAHAAYAATAAAYAAYAAAAAYRTRTLRTCARLVRKHLTWQDIEKALS